MNNLTEAVPKKSLKKPKESPKENLAMTSGPSEEDIQLAAYYLWKAKGEKAGEDREDWFSAEASFKEDYSD